MPDLVYLELNDDIGLETSHLVIDGQNVKNPKAGQPAELNNIGVQIPMPTMVGKEVAMTTSRATIQVGEQRDEHIRARILPGTRIVETDHPAVVNLLIETGHYHQIDPPKTEQPRKPKPDTKPDPGKED